MKRMLLILFGLALASGARAAEIRVTSDPPLPVANLLQNPNVEEGRDGQPDAWRFTTARPDNFEIDWVDGGRSGKCLRVRAKSAVMSGYWAQSVPVEPGKKYLFRGYYRLMGGKMLCYAHARTPLPDGRSVAVDQRFYRGTMRGHWLAPVFLPPDSLGGPDPNQWYPFRIIAEIPPPMQAISLSLGLFFEAGEVWFDDLHAGLAETELAIQVKAGPGESIERVTVMPVDADKPVFDSGPLAAGTSLFEKKLGGQPTDAVYEVVATLAGGKKITARYPQIGEGESR